MYRVLITLAVINLATASLWDGDLSIADGVKLVSVHDNSVEDESRSLGSTPLLRIAKFLQNHELHVKLPNLIEKDKLGQILSESLKAIDDSNKEKTGE